VFATPLIGNLAPAWSLAVEEHFYFLWPMCVRKLGNRRLMAVLSVVIVAEPLVRTVSYLFHPMNWMVGYMLTPFRLDGLAYGALVGLMFADASVRERIVAHRARVSWGLAIMFVGFIVPLTLLNWRWEEHILAIFSVGFSGIELTSALLLMFLLMYPESPVTAFFSTGVLRFFGRISYGLYLYHEMIRTLIRRIEDHFGYHHYERMDLLAFPLAVLVAWLSFELVEKRFLNLGRRVVERYRSDRLDLSLGLPKG
jgi:peptidoglycan/LPS O-acetylase OafA/YrhL